MKKIFLLGAIAGAAASPMTSAFAATVEENIRVYGRVDLSMDGINNKDGTAIKQVDNSSRLGVRGVEDLGAGLTALFGLEMGFGADTGESTNPEFRHSYVGLRGDFGALALGRLDSDQATGSPLYSQVTKSVTFVAHDAGATAIGTRWLNTRNRNSNAVGYMSPVWDGFSVRARYHQPDPSDAAAQVLQEGDVKAIDVGLNYESKTFSGGIGYGTNRRTGAAIDNDFRRKWQAVGSYDFGVTKISAVVGRDNYNGTATSRSDVNYWLVGFDIPLKKNVHHFTTNYMQRDAQNDTQGKGTNLQTGYTYHMSKRTKLFALYARENANTRIINQTSNQIDTVSGGIQHRF